MKTSPIIGLIVSLTLAAGAGLTGCGKGHTKATKAKPATAGQPPAAADADKKPTPAKPAAAPSAGQGGDELQRQADAGDPGAQLTMGRVCEASPNPEEVNEAVAWYKRAAKQGNAEAMYRAGLCYLRGVGGAPKDQPRALKMLEAAAAAGSADAQTLVAKLKPPEPETEPPADTAAAPPADTPPPDPAAPKPAAEKPLAPPPAVATPDPAKPPAKPGVDPKIANLLARATCSTGPDGAVKRLSAAGRRAGGTAALTADDLQTLAKFTSLDTLHLVGQDLGNNLAFLTNLTLIADLKLTNDGIGDGGLSALRNLKKLKTLDLSHNQIRGSGVRELAGCERLQRLTLADNGCDNSVLAAIGALPALTYVDLSGNAAIDDQGLKTLASGKKLDTVDLHKTKVTKEGVAELKKTLPKLRIKF